MGKIEIDHTGSGGGITLSSDGTDLLLDGTAVGGSALELYAENPSSPTAPSATGTNAVAIGSGAVSSGSGSVALGLSHASGLSSFAAANNYNNTSFGAIGAYSVALGNFAKASTTSSVAIGQGAQSTGNAAVTISAATSGLNGASGAVATAIGGNSSGSGSNATGTAAMALGGSYASGASSFAAAIDNNTSSYGATGANSVAMGYQAKATAEYSVSFGPSNNVTAAYSGAYGRGNTVSGGGTGYAFGSENTVSSGSAFAFGSKASAATNKFAFSTSRFSSNGDAQEGKYILRSDTTNATSEALTTNNGTPFSDNQVILPNNSAYAFHGTIVARQKAGDGTASAAWKVEGLIRREGSAGTTVLVNSATTVLDNTPSWGMALSADTTNGGLAITVTGAASTNIRWVATIHTSEVTYA